MPRSSQGDAAIRTILDTSVLIRSLIKGWWRQFAGAIEDGRLVLISSPAAIDEFVEVVSRPAFRDLIAPHEDLLVLKKHGNTEIIYVAEFLIRLQP